MFSFKLIVGLAHGQLDQRPDSLSCPPDTILSGPETDFCGSQCSERYCCDSDKGHCINDVCPEMCETGCFCAPGLARDPLTNLCIPKDECNSRPVIPECNVNEVWNECGSKCAERFCCDSDKGHCLNEICSDVCEARCECERGYARSYQGHCVPKEECLVTDGAVWNPDPQPSGVPSECPGELIWNECGHECNDIYCCPGVECDMPFCTEECQPRCECPSGTYQNRFGLCVPTSDETLCPVVQECPNNKVWNMCGNSCKDFFCCPDEECFPPPCAPGCNPRCECPNGMYPSPWDFDLCVTKDDACDAPYTGPPTTIGPVCPVGCVEEDKCDQRPDTECGPNEHWVECDYCTENDCKWGMACAKKCANDWSECCLIENQCVCDDGYARYTDTHFPELNKCVPVKECPNNISDMEIPEDIPEDMPSATTEQPPVDDGLNAADCAGTVDYKFRSGKAKVSRSGENSNLVRLQQAKVKETKAHTGFVSFPKSACGKDFLAGLKDGRVTVDFADKKATYSVIGSYYVDNGSSTQVVVQYNSVPLNVADDKCPKCLGNSSTDQLEMLVMGTKNIEWGSKTAKSCLNGALVGHAGAAGAPTLLENDESGCVAWTNAL